MKGVVYGTHKSLKDIVTIWKREFLKYFSFISYITSRLEACILMLYKKKINNTMQKIHFLARSRKSIKFKFTKPH